MELIENIIYSSIFWNLLSVIIGMSISFFAYKNYLSNKSKDKRLKTLENEKEFIDQQVELINSATISIQLCLHTIHSSNNNWKADRINSALETALRKGLIVRVISSTGSNQLKGGYELAEKLNIPVKFCSELKFSDLRFLKIDSDNLMIGLANTSRNDSKYKPSSSWATINSHGLGQLIDIEFERLWLHDSTTSFYEYFSNYISKYLGDIPPKKISNETSIPIDFIKRYSTNRKLKSTFSNYVLIFHGKSAAGKSKLIELLAKKWALRVIDLDDLVLPYIHRYGNNEVKGEIIKDIYSELIDYYQMSNYDIIETGTDYPEFLLPKLIDIANEKKRIPLLVYCKVDSKTALERNSSRNRPIPTSIIFQQQEEEEKGKFIDLCEEKNVQILEFDFKNNPQQLLDKLETKLNELS